VIARALAVLAEALVSGKRVVVVGDSSLALHDLLSELGARTVHVFDPDGARALAQPPPTQRGTVLRALPEGDFEVRDGAFDLAIVPDLALVREAAALLARLRRVVGGEGAVLCAAPNIDADGDETRGGGIGYYELYDLVSLQFSHVRMIAAMPFSGLTLAELGQDEVDAAVRVDTQLAGERLPPTHFAALASQEEVALDAYTIVELPAAARVEREERPLQEGVELAQARLRAEYLEAQVEELASVRAAHARAEEATRRALDALEVERERAARLERDLDKARAAAPPPPRDADVARDLAEQLAQAQLRASALEEGVELAEKTIIVQRDRIAELEATLADEAARKVQESKPEGPDDVAALETKLRERGEVVAALEAEVARRDKLVRELVAQLESAAPIAGQTDEELVRRLDELARLAARQKSDLEAQAWRLGELERLQR